MSLALSAPRVQWLTGVQIFVSHEQRYVSEGYIVHGWQRGWCPCRFTYWTCRFAPQHGKCV